MADCCCCNQNDQQGIKSKIMGCNFMLAPMTERYEDVIMGAIMKLDSSRVWSNTGKMGTVYRGYDRDVLDAVKACFAYAYHEDVHMTLTMTLSKGCPGDSADDYVFSEDDVPANAAGMADIHFPVDVKFALYPMGEGDYLEHIMHVVDEAKTQGVYKDMMHYATVLQGDVHEIFDYFTSAVQYCSENLKHFVFEITMSVNSPTVE